MNKESTLDLLMQQFPLIHYQKEILEKLKDQLDSEKDADGMFDLKYHVNDALAKMRDVKSACFKAVGAASNWDVRTFLETLDVILPKLKNMEELGE